MNRPEFDSWLMNGARPPLLMGVLNVTPDSFSDGGRHFDISDAVAHGLKMVADGASVIDVGGESTRPGSEGVDVAEQIRRTVPVIRALADVGIFVSIDTTSADVAEAALAAGACLINDVSAGRADPRLFGVAARAGVPMVLMHMQGEPRSMQTNPQYEDVVHEVATFLENRAHAAISAGVAPHRVLLDVGIGFGKTLDHNLALLRSHSRFAASGFATVLGTSRKSFIGMLTGRAVAAERVFGTAATVAWGITNGAHLLRVHDVAEMRDVVRVMAAIVGAPTAG